MNSRSFLRKWMPPEVFNHFLRLRGSLGPNPYRCWHDATASIFIHIPKTAGTSIAQNLYQSGPNHTGLKYFQAYDSGRYEKYFKFTVVRNPYDRFLSAVRNARIVDPAGKAHHPWFVDRFGSDISFDDLFTALENPRLRKRLKTHILFRPQLSFITDLSENIGLNYIGRFEQLQKTLEFIARKFELEGSFDHYHKSDDRNSWKEMVKGGGASLIEDMYAEDFNRLNYKKL